MSTHSNASILTHEEALLCSLVVCYVGNWTALCGQGLLRGEMLCNLANRMISTLQDLRQLTYSSEKMPVPYDYDPNEGPANIPLHLDAAMGFAVRRVLCARCACTDNSKQY